MQIKRKTDASYFVQIEILLDIALQHKYLPSQEKVNLHDNNIKLLQTENFCLKNSFL